MEEATSAGNIALYIAALVIVGPKLLDLGMSLFKGSVKRNVETADKADDKRDDRLDEHDELLQQHTLKLSELKQDHDNHKDRIGGELGNINGRLTALDTRISESNSANEKRFRDALSETTIEMNRRMTQILTTEIPQLVEDVLERRERKRGRK